MTQDEIEHMWKVASNDPSHDTNWHDPVVIAFAKLVAAKEREACAMVCDTEWDGDADTFTEAETSNALASAIRARGEQG